MVDMDVKSTHSGVEQKNAVVHLGQIKEKIMGIWESRVRSNVSSATEKEQLVLRYMLPELLENLTANLSTETTEVAENSFQRAGDIGAEHGEQRGNLNDYTISQVLHEYRILRQVIFEVLEMEKLYSSKIRDSILNVVDEGIQKAIERFTVVRSRELEQSNKDLEHFASIAAHDLKSPLATISGYMELLDESLKRKIDFEDAKYISTIKRSAAAMTVLIDRILEYSSVGRKLGAFSRVSTDVIVREVVESLDSLIETTGAKIIFQDLPTVVAESALLSQLFQNLISNAVKFRDENRTPIIRIEAKEEPDKWIFCVKDNGLGIKLEDRENLFTLFKKVHSKSSHKGYGIGLATARKIVELHGGTIWIESQPGIGSTFFFTIEK